jgi:hypothetical protein
VTTVDIEVAQRALLGPYLIKLDAHGFEVPILIGAQEALKKHASNCDGVLRSTPNSDKPDLFPNVRAP